MLKKTGLYGRIISRRKILCRMTSGLVRTSDTTGAEKHRKKNQKNILWGQRTHLDGAEEHRGVHSLCTEELAAEL
jgi:hypothetical protein